MKRLTALVLCLAMILTLAACGSTPAPTEAPTEPATEAPTEAPTEPATEPPTEPPLVFDTGWAGKSHEMPIPPLPVSDFTVDFSNYGPDLHYEILSDGDEIQELTPEIVAQYWNTIQDCGFDVNVTERTEEAKDGSTTYLYEAENAAGATIFLAYPSYMLYMILDIPTGSEAAETDPEAEATEPAEEAAVYDAAWASNDHEALIPEPPFAWEVWEQSCGENTHVLRSTDSTVTLQTIKAYAETLKSIGFSDVLEETEAADAYSLYAVNATNNAVSLEYEKGSAVIFLTGPIAQAAYNLSWAPNGIPQPPRFDTLSWDASRGENEHYHLRHLTCTGLTYPEVWDYTAHLRSLGFTEAPSLVSDPVPATYYFSACNESGISISILVMEGMDVTITLGLPK